MDLARHREVEQALLTDPQTSGGLLVACAPAALDLVMEIFRAEGFEHPATIGEVAEGEPGVKVV